MATQEEVEYVLEHLQEAHPDTFFKALNEGNVGIRAVLRILYEASDNITAGDISDYMHVSTARVAVLLKKMSEKGLIVKDADANDARITIVHLSQTGVQKVQQMKEEMYLQTGIIIDKLGMEKMMEFISILDEIKAAVSPPKLNF